MTRVLIEGWRGVNHSFALVNQCQILELLQLPGVQLFHRDLPFAMAHWNSTQHNPGFAPEDAARIAALAEPQGQAVDAVFRLCSPFRTGHDCAEAQGGTVPTLTFMVTEMGLTEKSFEPGTAQSDAFTRGANAIVTPTRWSRDRLLDWGYAPDKVHVVTHGVNAETFRPLNDAEREQSRRNLGMESGQYVFLNLGAALWNKGLDVLLLAYATLRMKHPHVRLVLKDQRSLYGVSIDATLGRLCQEYPERFTPETLASIAAITVNLSQQQLRVLYGMADCYVSPYRAEGFNLPVLEALACGTPAVVTAHGATDDFCTPDVALRIASKASSLESPGTGRVGRYQEPDIEATVQAMEDMALGRGIVRGPAFSAAADTLAKRLSWRRPAEELLALLRRQTQAAPLVPETA
jgi:glycosyltransferase involved in cell wall biosynthesis